MRCPNTIPVKRQDEITGVWTTTYVPCGKCYLCMQRRRNDWCFRNIQEYKHCYTAYFITLTYDDDHLPIKHCKAGEYKIPLGYDHYSMKPLFESKLIHEEFDVPTYSLDDIQKFLKRLRKHCEPCNDLRYFLVSEYGGEFFRPHYHAILYNFPGSMEDLAVALDKTWKKGFYYIGEANEATINYTCKYVLGACELPSFLDKPLMLSSRRPAIGKCFLTDSMVTYHRNRLQVISILENGNKVALPRYLRDKIFDNDVYKERITQNLQDYVRIKTKEDLENPEYFSNLRNYVSSLRNRITKSNSNIL